MLCCERPFIVTLVHERDEVSLCQTCVAIHDVHPRTVRAPHPSDFQAHLAREIELEQQQVEIRPWIPARIVDYEQTRPLVGVVTLELAEEPAFEWRPSDPVEFRGIDLRLPNNLPFGSVASVEGQRLAVTVAAASGLARVVGQAWVSLEVRHADLTHLLRNQLRVLNRLIADTDIMERLLDPISLPHLPAKPERSFIPLDELDALAATNAAQREAYEKTSRIPDGGIFLVQGPPGTGKTRLVANVVRAILRQGRTVLVTSHTNVAVDNVIEAATRLDPSFPTSVARYGPPMKVSADVAPLWRESRELLPDPEKENPTECIFANAYRERPVVAMTLAMLTNRIALAYSPRYEKFDYAIVDEASMNLLPALAAAVHVARRVVLVGDHRQLPPIIKAPEFAAKPGFAMGTFEALARARSDLITSLNLQYRSVPGIMDWSNRALYEGRLVTMRHDEPLHLDLAGSKIQGPVIWIDTTHVPDNYHVVRTPPGGDSPSFANPCHAAIAAEITRALLGQGIGSEDMGYISPFRSQANLYRTATRDTTGQLVTSSTVDAFQGREKRVILFDTTTTKPQRSHDSIQRLNVSLTRSRDLLVVLGVRSFADDVHANPYYHSLQQWFKDRPVVDARPLLRVETFALARKIAHA